MAGQVVWGYGARGSSGRMVSSGRECAQYPPLLTRTTGGMAGAYTGIDHSDFSIHFSDRPFSELCGFPKEHCLQSDQWMLNAAGTACPAEWPADAAPTEARHPPSGAQLCAVLAGVDHAVEAIYVWKTLRKLLEMLATCHSGLTPALGCEPAARRPSQQHAVRHGSLENKTPTWNFN